MQAPDNPWYDEVTRLHQRGRHNGQGCSDQPNDDEADLNRQLRVSEGLLIGSGLHCSFRSFRIRSRVRKRLYAEPEAYVVYWNSEILEYWVPKKEPEDVEDVMSIVGKSVGVDNRIEVYCEQANSNEEDGLQRLGVDGVRRLLFGSNLGSDSRRQQVDHTAGQRSYEYGCGEKGNIWPYVEHLRCVNSSGVR